MILLSCGAGTIEGGEGIKPGPPLSSLPVSLNEGSISKIADHHKDLQADANDAADGPGNGQAPAGFARKGDFDFRFFRNHSPGNTENDA